MGYNNDQLFGLDNNLRSGESVRLDRPVGGSRSPGVNVDADNPAFQYPARVVRVLDRSGKVNTVNLKRGYIRSMVTSASGIAIPIKKCQFQFNPTTLKQSVAQNSSILSFLQQPAAQYAQPIPASVNFQFDLFFDRSMEINNLSSLTAGMPTNELNPWETSDPGQIGVLRDLATLYSVIGQGMAEHQNKYLRQAQAQALSQSITAEANAATDAGEDVATDAAAALGNIDTFLANNMGNSAFLLPTPVRVVFSSLYVVEGLVTDSTVEFTKFNSAYVPMQAVLSITMEAKYIGFAQKSTFLTFALEQRAKQELKDVADFNTSVATFSDLVNKVTLNADRAGNPLGLLMDQVTLKATFPSVPTPAGRTVDLGPDPPLTDAVTKLFADGTLVGVDLSATARVFGPLPPDTLDLTLTTSDLLAFIVARDFGEAGGALFESSITPDSGGRATDSGSWRKFVEGTKGAPINVDEDDLDNSGDIYIYHYTVSVTVTTGGSTVTGTGDAYFAKIGFGADHSITISWPEARPTGTGTGGSVPSDNGASRVVRTQPGNSSQVGARVAV